MIKQILAVYLLLGCFGIAPGQEATYRDGVENKRHQWNLVQGRKLKVDFVEGKLEIRAKSAYEAQFLSQAIKLPMEDDFELILRITQTAGAKNMGFGLCWGAKADHLDWETFLISTNGKYTILNKSRGQYREIKRWTESQNIYKQDEINELKVIRQGDRMYYYLNEKKAFVSGASSIKGNEVGLLLHGTMTLQVEELIINKLPQD